MEKFAYKGEEDGGEEGKVHVFSPKGDNRREVTTVGSLEKVDGKGYWARMRMVTWDRRIQKLWFSCHQNEL